MIQTDFAIDPPPKPVLFLEERLGMTNGHEERREEFFLYVHINALTYMIMTRNRGITHNGAKMGFEPDP